MNSTQRGPWVPNVKTIAPVLGAVLLMFCASASAQPTAEQMLEQLNGIPLPDENFSDRGLMIDTMVEYVKSYIELGAQFRQRFPDHRKAAEIADRELSLISQIEPVAPDPLWDRHVEQMRQSNPDAVTRSHILQARELRVLMQEATQMGDVSPEALLAARRKMLDWAVANADYNEARDMAYDFAIMHPYARDSRELRTQWYDVFRRTWPEDPRSKVTPNLEPAVEIGEAVELVIDTVTGERIDTAKLKGKVIVVDFWATWCGPCRAAAEVLKPLYREYAGAGRLAIVGISMDQKKEDLDHYLAGGLYPWPIAWDEAGRYSARWQFRAIPHFLIIDQRGILRFKGNTGELRRNVLRYVDPQAFDNGDELYLQADDFAPLADANASAAELFKTLNNADGPSYDAIESIAGEEAAAQLLRMHEAAFAAKMCNLAGAFLRKYPGDSQCGRVLELWAKWATDKRLSEYPEIVKRVLGENAETFDRQIEWLRAHYGPTYPRLTELVALIYEARTAEQEGRLGQVYPAIKKRVINFCEAQPDDLLNVPAFFMGMAPFKYKYLWDPAKVCHVPVRLLATDIRGQKIDTANWRDKVVFIYWGYYPQDHLSMLRETWRKYHEHGFELVEVNIDGRKNVEEYVAKENVPWPVVVTGDAPADWRLQWLYAGYPNLCVLDQQGRIYYTDTGWGGDRIRLGEKGYWIPDGTVPNIVASLLKDSGRTQIATGEPENSQARIAELKQSDKRATYAGHLYLVVMKPASWKEARKLAEALGGHLATISDENENTFVGRLARRNGAGNVWIGLTDEAKEGSFVWVTSEPLTYTKWRSGEPNTSPDRQTIENYAVIVTSSPANEWNDLGGDAIRPFVVEFDGEPTR